MNYCLVLQAKNTANISGLPGDWPVTANPCEEDTKVPEGWEKLTQAGLDSLKASNMIAYEEWKQVEDAKEAEREEEEKEAEEAPCKSAEAKFRALGFTEPEIKDIMGDRYVGQ